MRRVVTARHRGTRVLAGLCLVLGVLLLLPGAALAATFSNITPANGLTVVVPNPQISVVATDTVSLINSGWWMKIDGRTARAKFAYGAGGTTTATIAVRPETISLVDGSHGVQVSLLNNNGQRFTTSWGFRVAVPPRVGEPSPVPSAVFESPNSVAAPTISARVTDNSGTAAIPTANVRMRIKRASDMVFPTDPVAASWNPATGVLSYTPGAGAELLNNSTYDVLVEVTDTAGLPASLQWSFKISYPKMSGSGDCATCHEDYPAAHPQGTPDDQASCDVCHGYDGPIGGFYGPPDYHPPGEAAAMLGDCLGCHGDGYTPSGYPTVPMHSFSDDSYHLSTVADTCTSASSCHNHSQSLSVEHNRLNIGAPDDLTCSTCHGPDVPAAVAAAVEAGNTDCTESGCHLFGDGDHPYIPIAHQSNVATDVYSGTLPGGAGWSLECQKCHVTELYPEHSRSSSSSAAAGCDNCHPSPRDSLTPWDKSCAQDECHAPASSSEKHAGFDAAHGVLPAQDDKCTGSGCHSAANLGDIHVGATSANGASCAVCHSTTSVPNTKYCMDCHPEKVEPSGDRDGAVVNHGYDAVRHTGTPSAAAITINGESYGPYACDQCHDLELKPEHEKASSITSSTSPICGACHPEPYESLPPPWDKTTCAQGDCHTSTLGALQHAGIDAAHTKDPANDQCATSSGCHTADVAAIHAGGPDCGACHESGVPTTTNCLTAGCHPDKVDSGGNVVEHGYSAATHTSSVAGSVLTGSMYPAPGTAYTFSLYGAPMRYGDWGGLYCGSCHNPELGLEHLDKASSSSRDDGCAACHAAGGPVASLPPTGWDGTCNQCHTAYHQQMESKHSVDPSGCDGFDCHYGEWKPDYAGVHNDFWWGQANFGSRYTPFPPNGCALANCHQNAVTVPTPLGCGEGSYCHPEHPQPLP